MHIDPDTMTFIFLVFLGVTCAYFVGVAMNGVMANDGFGSFLNATILIAGGFLGFHATRYFHLPLPGPTGAAVMVVSGAFMCLAFLAILKGFGRKIGF